MSNMTALWGETDLSPSKAVGVPEQYDRLEAALSPNKAVGVPEQYDRLIGGSRLILSEL